METAMGVMQFFGFYFGVGALGAGVISLGCFAVSGILHMWSNF